MSQPSEPTSNRLRRYWQGAQDSPLGRLLTLALFVGLLQVPISMISRLVGEREQTRREAIAEVSEKWGRSQWLEGPFLRVPYHAEPTASELPDPSPARPTVHYATFLPQLLEIDANVQTEVRYRGIFEVPVFHCVVDIRGRFRRPDVAALGIDPERVLWEQAEFVLEIADGRRIQAASQLDWAGHEIDFLPGTGRRRSGRSGIHAPLSGSLRDRANSPFATRLEFNGSGQLRFAPLGTETSARLRGNWPAPSFQGAWLPTRRSVSPEGFEADWVIPDLARDHPQQWRGGRDPLAIEASRFGVNLISSVDAYRSTQRILKYQILFLGLTFATLWLFEILAGLRIHPIQYALVGASMCLFYLLELSLAEQLGLAGAYALAALAVVGVVGAYARAILASRLRAALVAALLSGLYGYLYVLLRIESYALLLGSLGLLAILASIMYATRHVDWYALGRREAG